MPNNTIDLESSEVGKIVNSDKEETMPNRLDKLKEADRVGKLFAPANSNKENTMPEASTVSTLPTQEDLMAGLAALGIDLETILYRKKHKLDIGDVQQTKAHRVEEDRETHDVLISAIMRNGGEESPMNRIKAQTPVGMEWVCKVTHRAGNDKVSHTMILRILGAKEASTTAKDKVLSFTFNDEAYTLSSGKNWPGRKACEVLGIEGIPRTSGGKAWTDYRAAAEKYMKDNGIAYTFAIAVAPEAAVGDSEVGAPEAPVSVVEAS